MNFKIIAAAALLSLGALPAFAAEGNGEPFFIQAPGVTSASNAVAADTGSETLPVVAGRPGSTLGVYASVAVLDTGNETPVQTANSLPVGAATNFRAFANLGTSAPVLTVMAQVGPRG